jgi:phosphoserine aminotransferase
VSYVLGMLNDAADGETRQQITDVLGLGGSVQEINEYFKKMMDEAQSVDPSVTLKTANCIEVVSGYRINPQYKADMQNYYNALVDAVSYNESSILNKINNWCKAHTDGMIPELLKKGELHPNRRMYLLNAVYFKASWTDKFDPEETRDRHFTKRDGTTIKLPMMHLKTKAAYVDSGTWANKAIKEAKLFGEVEVVASSKEDNYIYYPKNFTVPADADYLHITTNNTIYGTELREDLDVNVPLVADMSSDIFSRPVDVSKYALIYGGAQKNLAPAGVTFVIIKKDILGKVDRAIPTMLNYQTHIDKGSMFNTPPVLPIFTALQTLRWLKDLGGVKEMQRINEEKGACLYDAIDNSRMFVGTTHEDSRSLMNVCFVMKPEYKELEKDFLEFATSKGIVGIKGHRSVGGFRASLYNALPLESVKVLVDAMKEFENNH